MLALFLWINRPSPFPALYADRYVSVFTNQFRNLGEEYVERFVDLINSTETRRLGIIESERRPTPGNSPDNRISFVRENGDIYHVSTRGDIIQRVRFCHQMNLRYGAEYVIVDLDRFRAELEQLYQEIWERR